MTGDRSPSEGDVVILKDSGSEAAYSLSVVPGLPQVLYRSYDLALANALEWSTARRITIWKSDDGLFFTRID